MSAEAEKFDPLDLRPENIPDELKVLNQWVVWRLVETDGKWKKVPLSPTTKKYASVNDSSTWTNFETALSVYNSGEDYSGIGIVLTGDDPYIGIDFDYCIDPYTEKITPDAKKVIKACQSYTEYSPSGTGIRIFIKGKPLKTGRKNNNIEIYDRGRYLTVTGQILTHDQGTDINSPALALAYLNRNFFSANSYQADNSKSNIINFPKSLRIRLDKALNSSDGPKIRKLLDGDSLDYPSHSEADLALCATLANLSFNEKQIDSVFRGSGLYRPKWDKIHSSSGETYGQRTILKAITSANNPSKISSDIIKEDSYRFPKIVPLSELLNRNFDSREDIIGEKILVDGGSLILAGSSGVGKSLITLEMAISLAAGTNLYADRIIIPKSRKVLIFQSENAPFEVRQRINKMTKGSIPDGIFINSDTVYNFNIADNYFSEYLIRTVRETRVDVIIIDPLSSFHHYNENDNSQMRSVLDSITNISRETGAATIIVHHYGKQLDNRADGNKLRGATSIKDAVDTIITLERRRQKNENTFRMNFEKVRYGVSPKPIDLVRDEITLLHDLTSDEGVKVSSSVIEDILKNALNGKVDKKSKLLKAIAEKCECSERTAATAVKQAVESGHILEKRVGRKTIVWINT